MTDSDLAQRLTAMLKSAAPRIELESNEGAIEQAVAELKQEGW